MAKNSEDEVLRKVDQILRVLTLSATKGMKQTEQITFLDRVGLSPKDIAAVLGTTSNTVSVALSGIRRSRSKKK